MLLKNGGSNKNKILNGDDMSKKRKIDYIIEQSDDERLIFRFYPRKSSCHSFGDEPPKSLLQRN